MHVFGSPVHVSDYLDAHMILHDPTEPSLVLSHNQWNLMAIVLGANQSRQQAIFIHSLLFHGNHPTNTVVKCKTILSAPDHVNH